MYIADATSIEIISEKIKSLNLSPDEQLFIAIGEKTWSSVERLVDVLRTLDVRFFGGVFPGVVVGGRKYDKGLVVTRLPMSCSPQIVQNVSNGDCDFNALNRDACDETQSVFVFVDGLTSNISSFLHSLRGQFNENTIFAGGGAGSISLKQMPCVFSQDGVFQDAAVLGMVSRKSFQGVRHGWRDLEGPFIANKTKGNVLVEFNWKDAFQFYSEIVEKDSGQTLSVDNFYSLAMCYPFGIHTDGMEDVVRDPLMITPGGHLLCCGDIPNNTVVGVLKGNRNDLIMAAERAAQDCVDQTTGRKVTHAIVVDCISRMYFLGEYFERELDVISSKLAVAVGAPEPLGVLSLGEVASYGEKAVELFNKTTVLTVVTE